MRPAKIQPFGEVHGVRLIERTHWVLMSDITSPTGRPASFSSRIDLRDDELDIGLLRCLRIQACWSWFSPVPFERFAMLQLSRPLRLRNAAARAHNLSPVMF